MDSTRTRTIGERIRSSRERHRLTLEETAARTAGGFTASRLANYEQGIRRPGVEEVEAMAAVFGDVSVAWLLTLEDAPRAGTGPTQDARV